MSDIIGFSKFTKEINCPVCGKKFSKNEIEIIRCEDDGVSLIRLICEKCQKGFAIGVFGLNVNEIKSMLSEKTKQNPINYDDILDFHKNLPDLEKEFYKYIKDNNLK